MYPDIITDLQDMRYLKWDRIRHSSGTAGSYLKSYDDTKPKKIYYKLSNYDPMRGIIGHEAVNELIADRLLSVLHIEHLSYQLIHALVTVDDSDHETWLCASEDFKEQRETKIALDDYYELEKKSGESPMDFISRMGWENYIYTMLLVDFLIVNRDRHGANIEILQSQTNGTRRPAPLFDHGLSMVFSCTSEDELDIFDVMADIPVQCFVGGHSAYDNLSQIPKGSEPSVRRLEDRDREAIFTGLCDALSQAYQDKIWEMLIGRWRYYEKDRNL